MDGWTLLIAAHACAALLALGLGAAMVVRTKGDETHRRVGRVWLILMYWVSLSSFGITRLRPGHFTWIHLLSLWTLFSLTMSWRYARTGDLRHHRRWATGSYGGLLGAFLGAVAVPARLIPRTLALHRCAVAIAVAVGVAVWVGVRYATASSATSGRSTRM